MAFFLLFQDQFSYILIAYFDSVEYLQNIFDCSVSEMELKRLKEAFKRSSTLSGCMTENLFTREVLLEGVPPKLAQVYIYFMII